MTSAKAGPCTVKECKFHNLLSRIKVVNVILSTLNKEINK